MYSHRHAVAYGIVQLYLDIAKLHNNLSISIPWKAFQSLGFPKFTAGRYLSDMAKDEFIYRRKIDGLWIFSKFEMEDLDDANK